MNINEYGINSLRGFAYQIKVFLYYLTKLNDNEQVEFETIDDIALNKSNVDSSINSNSHNIKTLICKKDELTAIQVKQTKTTAAKNKKIIFNWLIVQQDLDINKFILCMDENYSNDSEIFDSIDSLVLYREIMDSNRKSTALISQVKEIYKERQSEFINDFDNIKNKYEAVEFRNIDEEIDKNCELFFHKPAITEIKYYLRIKELLKEITAQIIDSISKNKPFKATKIHLMKFIEEICINITNDVYIPNFATFKKLNNIDISKTEISSTREYKQLCACDLSTDRIETHLLFEQYYFDFRMRDLENILNCKIENIEELTFDNFCCVKESLNPIEDKPKTRLAKTKEKNNSYCSDEQIRYGSCIYLTGDGIEKEKQISWDENE